MKAKAEPSIVSTLSPWLLPTTWPHPGAGPSHEPLPCWLLRGLQLPEAAGPCWFLTSPPASGVPWYLVKGWGTACTYIYLFLAFRFGRLPDTGNNAQIFDDVL